MFKKQDTIELSTEKKALLITNDLDNNSVREIDQALGRKLKDLTTKPFTVIHTLGKLTTEKLYVMNKDALLDAKTKGKIVKEIGAIEEDVLLVTSSLPTAQIADFFESVTRETYRFERLKSKKKDTKFTLYYTANDREMRAIEEGIILGESINHTRDLVNTPYNYLNATDLATYAKELERFNNMSVAILNKKEIEAMNMGAFLGVNKGSKDEPKLIHIKYRGHKTSKDITSLVGKGVMYDTGGYSLKTPQFMPTMKMDMGGAATVLGAIEAIARLGYEHNVDVIIAATDNRIGDEAIVPDDILTAANGLTIEIVSTDAEGRLTLADALWYAQKEGATRVIDVATLTGAIVAALGKEYTGAFTNNQAFLKELTSVSDTTKEPIWQMPISDAYREELKSYSADISNKGGKLAGASIAAAFLEKFVSIPWIHLDIAGTTFTAESGATGRMVKTLTHLFK